MPEKRSPKKLGKQNLSLKNSSGLAGKRTVEIVPLFLQSESEKVLQGSYNSSIVFGKDRNGSYLTSKLSSTGYTQIGMLDLVAGRAPGLIVDEVESEDGTREQLYVNPNFEEDAARVYISQRSDIDAHLGIKNQKANAIAGFQSVVPDTNFGKSTVAIISDNTRICGRENVKIFTKYFSKNSLDGKSDVGGVELIAGGITDNGDFSLQPMVKGRNLQEALEEITIYITNIGKVLQNFIKHQMIYNDEVARHYHLVPSIEIPLTDPPFEIAAMNTAQIGILSVPFEESKRTVAEFSNYINTTYLTEGGEKSINSLFNKVN